ncbi:MAG: YgjP-like metallopeptidase domain-containing protein [[Eubacterium] siraeum]
MCVHAGEAVYRQRRYLRSTFILWNILCKRRRYVVAHEFTHFLQANHSARFYAELARYISRLQAEERILK